jgi:hypothetical protein
MRTTVRTVAATALVAASSLSQFPHPAVAAVGLRAAVPAPVAGIPSIGANAAGGVLNFRGIRVRIGAAAFKTQALLKAHPNFVLPTHPLFVADPALNAIVMFNANGSGTQLPSAVLAGPNTQLNGPDSVVEGWDVPCNVTFTSSTCTHYLFVVNAGNNTVLGYQYPLTSANQAPYFTFTAPASCQLGLGFPAGVEHVHPNASHSPGYLVVSDEHAATNGALEVFNVPTVPGPGVNCPIADDTNAQDARLTTPSGVSLYGSPGNARFFNANATTVTEERFRFFFLFTPKPTWAVGGATPASTQGTAFDSSESGGGYLWVTTAHGMTSWPDGVWLCTLSAFATASCPNAGPTITAGLSFPVFPKTSPSTHRLYVPNLTNCTVTSYPEGGPYTPFATYTNLASPWDVAGLDF